LKSGSDELPQGPLVDIISRAMGALSPDARRWIQAASVLGKTFSTGAALYVLASPSRSLQDADRKALFELYASELVARRGGARGPWGEEISFRHPLVRDVAYASLDEPSRCRYLLRAGDWLERAGDNEPGILAGFFQAAGAMDRAVPWAALAAEAAFEASDFDAVLTWVSLGLQAASAGEVRGALRLFESQARKFKGEHRPALVAGREAMSELPLGSPLWYSAAGEVALAAISGTSAYNVSTLVRAPTSWATSPARNPLSATPSLKPNA